MHRSGPDRADQAIAAAIDPTEYREYFHREHRFAPYYSAGREWRDYEPAYRYGYDSYGRYHGRRFEDIEPDLRQGWTAARATSRLEWPEVREAVRDGWHHIDRYLPRDPGRSVA